MLPARIVVADRGDAGRRIDLVLLRHLGGLDRVTRSRIRLWIEAGRVDINGRPVRRASARTVRGDAIAVRLPADAPRAAMAAEAGPLSVLHEDASLLVVDKPAGLVVHPTHAHASGTLMNRLLWHARGWPAGGGPSLVGRLDRLTSGLVVVARGPGMHAALQRAWRAPGTVKEYLALVHGRVSPERGRIAVGLMRDPGDRRRVIAADRGGAPSVTIFERVGRPAAHGGMSVVRCRLLTGRTHQIRVHLAARGWPVAGDRVYGTEPASIDPAIADAILRLPGHALHAWRVALPHPATGRRLEVEAPLPAAFRDLMQAAGVDSGTLPQMFPAGDPKLW